MDIKKIFEQDSVQRTYNKRKDGLSGNGGGQREGGVPIANEDSVNLSSLSKGLSLVPDILSEDELAQANKVKDIKERVANGTYIVDSHSVAGALVSYAFDTKDLG